MIFREMRFPDPNVYNIEDGTIFNPTSYSIFVFRGFQDSCALYFCALINRKGYKGIGIAKKC